MAEKAPRASQAETALRARSGHRHIPPLVHFAEDVAIGNEDVIEEHLGETRVAVESRDRAHADARRAERNEEVRHPAMTLAVRIRSKETEHPVAERAARAPRLLAGEAPPAAHIVAHAAAGEARQIAPRVRLRPPLCPHVEPRGHARQEALLLLLRSELEDRRREEEDPVLRDPLRRARSPVLLLEEQPLEDRGLTTTVRPRPRHDRPLRVEELLLPDAVKREPLGGVA